MNAKISRIEQSAYLVKIGFSFLLVLFLMVSFANASPINVDGDGVALQGYDPVAYFTMNKAVKGNSEFTAEHNGGIYHFASAENQAKFVAMPDKYAPQYGGYCAYGLAYGSKASIEVDQFTVNDGKLFMNFDNNIQSRWRKDPDGYIKKANANWSKME